MRQRAPGHSAPRRVSKAARLQLMRQGWLQVARLWAGAKEQRAARLSPPEQADGEHLLALAPTAERLAQRQSAYQTGLQPLAPVAAVLLGAVEQQASGQPLERQVPLDAAAPRPSVHRWLAMQTVMLCLDCRRERAQTASYPLDWEAKYRHWAPPPVPPDARRAMLAAAATPRRRPARTPPAAPRRSGPATSSSAPPPQPRFAP